MEIEKIDRKRPQICHSPLQFISDCLCSRLAGKVTMAIRDGKVQAYALNGRGLVGGSFQLDYPSIGATKTLLMAACMADGTTILSNVAREPEVVDLARFLTNSGAFVEGAGSNKLVIKGKSHLHGCKCTIAPDRIEAGTFMLAAAITRSFISISPVIPSQVSCLMQKLLAAGCKIRQCCHDTVEVSAVSRCGENLRGFEVKTGPFPGFPTDLQPQTMALLSTWFKSCRRVYLKSAWLMVCGIYCVHPHLYYICRFSINEVVCLVPALLQLTSEVGYHWY